MHGKIRHIRPGSIYFRKGGNARTHHLKDIARHPAAGDYLRTHPDARKYGKTYRKYVSRMICTGGEKFVKKKGRLKAWDSA